MKKSIEGIKDNRILMRNPKRFLEEFIKSDLCPILMSSSPVILDREEDSVRYYFFCERCRKNFEVSGLGSVREEDGLIVV